MFVGFGKQPGEDKVFKSMECLHEWEEIYSENQKTENGFFAKTESGKWLCQQMSLFTDEYQSLEWGLKMNFNYEGPIPEQFEILTLELKEDGAVDVKFQ